MKYRVYVDGFEIEQTDAPEFITDSERRKIIKNFANDRFISDKGIKLIRVGNGKA